MHSPPVYQFVNAPSLRRSSGGQPPGLAVRAASAAASSISTPRPGRVRRESVAVLPADLLREDSRVHAAGPARHLLDADVGGRHAEGDAGGGAHGASGLWGAMSM